MVMVMVMVMRLMAVRFMRGLFAPGPGRLRFTFRENGQLRSQWLDRLGRFYRPRWFYRRLNRLCWRGRDWIITEQEHVSAIDLLHWLKVALGLPGFRSGLRQRLATERAEFQYRTAGRAHWQHRLAMAALVGLGLPHGFTPLSDPMAPWIPRYSKRRGDDITIRF